MKLSPHPHREKRHEKVLKHWFSVEEAWWAVDGDAARWAQDRQALGEVLHGEPPAPSSVAETVLAGAYERYKGLAEQACDGATARGTVFPTEEADRACYVGWPGITVIVAAQRAAGDEKPFVTSFRVAPHSRTTDAAFDEAALARARRKAGVFDRQAVRFGSRRASLASRKER